MTSHRTPDVRREIAGPASGTAGVVAGSPGAWRAGVAVVLGADGVPHGAGFAAADGVVVTCAHVVEGAGSGPGDRIRVAFPQVTGVPETVATVDPGGWRDCGDADVAVLRLDELPAGVEPLALGAAAGSSGHRVAMFGVPEAGRRERYGYATAGDVLSGPLLQLTGANDVTVGFSGSPVVDETTGLVIGMVTAIDDPDTHQRSLNVAYATPAETLREAAPELGEQAVCPYRGLASFTVDDERWFHGRQDVVRQVAENLGRRAILLLGPSGSGKSSLIHAGVLPEIAAGRAAPGSETWKTVTVRPGPRLAAVVQDVRRDLAADSRLVLVIDQLEEVFTPDAESPAREALAALDELIGSPEPLTVILIMRDDFYARLAATAPGLLRSLTPGLVNIPAVLTRREAEDIVVRPAATAGLRIEPGLAARILTDLETVAGGSGERRVPVTALPLLELALLQLWERRRDGRLTHDGYQRIGGLAGSLTARCDHSIAALSAGHRQTARVLLTALVRPGDPPVRRQVPLDDLRDLAPDGDADTVLRALTTGTPLVVTHAEPGRPPVAELIHDSLIRDWATLHGWVTQDARFHDWLRRAEEQRQQWAATAGAADLLRGLQLSEGLDWSARRRLPTATTTFLQASKRAATAGVRRTRMAVSVMAALLVLAVGAAVTAYVQRGRAVELQQAAVKAQQEILSRQLAAQSQVIASTEPDLSALLAVHAYRSSPTREALAGLYSAYATRRPLLRTIPDADRHAVSEALSPDGRTLLEADEDGSVRLRTTATGAAGRAFTGNDRPITSLALSPDGTTLAAGTVSDGTADTVVLWNTVTGSIERRLVRLHDDVGDVEAVAFSPDGKTLAAGMKFSVVRLWDVATGGLKRVLTGPGTAVVALAFSPDGRTLAGGSMRDEGDDDASYDFTYRGDGSGDTIHLWDVRTGAVEHVLAGHNGGVSAVAFSPDGRTLASGSHDNTVRLWDPATGAARRTLPGHNGGVSTVAFSPDGRTLASGGGDGTIQLWDAGTGLPRQMLADSGSPAPAVAFTPDNRTLVSFGGDGWIRLWDAHAGAPRVTITRPADGGGSVAFSPDGRIVAGHGGGQVLLWNAESGALERKLGRQDGDTPTMFSPDGSMLTSGVDGDVCLWDVRTGVLRHTLAGNDGDAEALAFSPDGATLAIATTRVVRLWDTATGESRQSLPASDVTALVFSHDGTTLAMTATTGGAGDRRVIRLWDTRTNGAARNLAVRVDGPTALTFEPDGVTLAVVASDDGSGTSVWSLNTVTGATRQVSVTGGGDSTALSPGGATLAGGDVAGTIVLWDTATGVVQDTLLDANKFVSSLTFSPGGTVLAEVSDRGKILLWPARVPGPEGAAAHICAAIGHDLSAADTATYLPGRPVTRACPG